MASPISIGDAFLLAKLALKLGQTFTTGRKSAPAEFREVESQLYSISTALTALGDACRNNGLELGINNTVLQNPVQSPRGNKGDDALLSMLQGCQDVLKNLEGVVEKYSSIGQPEQSNRPCFQKWKSGVKKNWKKIIWTTEGGDLAALQRSLSIHINCLDLALGVIGHTRTDRVEKGVVNTVLMLTEIHTWFVTNIRDNNGSGVVTSAQNTNVMYPSATEPPPPLTEIQFKISARSLRGLEVLCPNASIHPMWNQKRSEWDLKNSWSHRKLFKCNCPLLPGQTAPHPFEVDSLAVSSFTFALRQTGATKSWMIYNAANRSTNMVISLVIENVLARSIHEFETSFIDVLATNNAKAMFRPGCGTTLAYITAGKSQPIEHRILNFLSDLDQVRNKVEKVTFTMKDQSYTRTEITTIKLMHYKSSTREYLSMDYVVDPKDLLPLDTAELEITYTQGSDSDIAKSILYTAMLLQRSIQNMREELFVMSLKAPRPGERLALKLEAKGFHTDRVDMADCEISIVQSDTSGDLRLIITSKDERTILSQDLAKDFMETAEGTPRFSAPTYAVQIVGQGTRDIQTYKNGFKMVDFSDVRRDRLFGLGLAVLSGSGIPLPRITQAKPTNQNELPGYSRFIQ
ncbi:hypothetical protein AOL_s00097g83 [Orbilia oligospora ATCC 24927]|uniref:Fungal N-terminal domain-containing protein n=1 Tax=Arthrobotrys oligospora (strain ATCC 24927 / CBS 115.81 / DSM 1491) TaxID=756982 RepID=G1XIA6_ARTOA|nr:hypothetical protein AOL_s00097g83 [Orbilia oligospora ATCC 24927]EGX47037.1 hypothetical protein AOL_s00097g83 [Orbilia oligospora ATCC 24927]